MQRLILNYSSGSDKIKKEYYVDIDESEETFKRTTVRELKTKIVKKEELLQIVLKETLLKFNGQVLRDYHTLLFYGIKPNSIIELIKEYDPVKLNDFQLTIEPDAITGENSGEFKVRMSCGHAVDPNSLTAYCRSLIDQGRYKLTCPAIIESSSKGNKLCEKEWNYYELRLFGMLNELERDYFEEKLSKLVARSLFDYKQCPNCKSYIERQNKNNLRVSCTLCKVFSNKSYEFCWQCEKEWALQKQIASATCGRKECENSYFKILSNCTWIKLPNVPDLPPIPSIRACPTCGSKVEHNTENCKNVICPGCENEFCFACLRPKIVCSSQGSGPYGICSVPVAPTQTVIPCST